MVGVIAALVVLALVADWVDAIRRPRHWWIYHHDVDGGRIRHEHRYVVARWLGCNRLVWWHFRHVARPRCERPPSVGPGRMEWRTVIVDTDISAAGGPELQDAAPYPWTFALVDLVTGAVYDRGLPITVDSFGDLISDVTSTLQGSIDVRPAEVRDRAAVRALVNAVVTEATLRPFVVVIEGPGNPLAAYSLTYASLTAAGTLTLTGTAFGSVLAFRQVWDDLTYVDVDQFVIARDLVAYAQGQPTNSGKTLGSGVTAGIPAESLPLGITTDTALSGVARTKAYAGADSADVATLLTDLAELDGGIDYAFDVVWSAEDNRYWFPLRLGYPYLGRTLEQTGLQFTANTVNGNVLDWTLATGGGTGGDGSANVVREAGQGSGGSSGEDVGQTFSAPAVAVQAGAPVMMATVSRPEEADPENLGAYAVADVVRFAGDGRTLTVTLRGDAWPILGTFNRGDTALFTIEDAPGRIEFEARIVGWTVRGAKVDLILAIVED